MEIIISFLLCNQGMKGYLTKEHKKLVLPAENAFPSIEDFCDNLSVLKA